MTTLGTDYRIATGIRAIARLDDEIKDLGAAKGKRMVVEERDNKRKELRASRKAAWAALVAEAHEAGQTVSDME